MARQIRRSPVLHLAIVAALLAGVLPGLVLGRVQAKEEFGLPAAELNVANASSATQLDALDAGTLDPRPDRPAVRLGSAVNEAVPVLSEDGSTFVLSGNDGTIVVRDGLMGPERLRFFPDGTVGELALSRDGRRLVATVVADYSSANLKLPAWKVFDTADGRLLATVENDESGDPWEEWVVDAGAQRLYRLAYADGVAAGAQGAGPYPTVLIANDLVTGAEVGRLDLPGVRAGWWQSEETVAIGGGQEPLTEALLPAVAVSHDGRRLAIVHADEDALTVVDTERLAIEATQTLARSASVLHRLVALLPLVPQSASAKTLEGTMLQAVFAPDGRHLYVFGVTSGVESGEPIFHGLGLRVVDVESGEVEAVAFDGMPIERVVPSPDGGSLYVAGPALDSADAESDTAMVPYLIWRVDAETLEVVAERSFTGWRWFLMRSALADPALPLTVELVDMAFMPSLITVPADTEVRLVVVNHGSVPHSLRAGDDASHELDVRVDVAPGESETITYRAPAGEYKMFCDVTGHAEAGMGGAIVAR